MKMKAKEQPPPDEIRIPYSFTGEYYVDFWRTEKYSDMDLIYVRKNKMITRRKAWKIICKKLKFIADKIKPEVEEILNELGFKE